MIGMNRKITSKPYLFNWYPRNKTGGDEIIRFKANAELLFSLSLHKSRVPRMAFFKSL